MSRINGYLSAGRIQSPLTTTRAAAAWNRIQRNSSTIVIQRGTATTVATQVVRIESERANEVTGESGKAAKRNILVFGIVGHSSTADTDIQRDDRFSFQATPAGRLNYRVIHVDKTQIGEIQATAEEIQ